jgi:hypothetical protein
MKKEINFFIVAPPRSNAQGRKCRRGLIKAVLDSTAGRADTVPPIR